MLILALALVLAFSAWVACAELLGFSVTASWFFVIFLLVFFFFTISEFITRYTPLTRDVAFVITGVVEAVVVVTGIFVLGSMVPEKKEAEALARKNKNGAQLTPTYLLLEVGGGVGRPVRRAEETTEFKYYFTRGI